MRYSQYTRDILDWGILNVCTTLEIECPNCLAATIKTCSNSDNSHPLDIILLAVLQPDWRNYSLQRGFHQSLCTTEVPVKKFHTAISWLMALQCIYIQSENISDLDPVKFSCAWKTLLDEFHMKQGGCYCNNDNKCSVCRRQQSGIPPRNQNQTKPQ